MPRTTLDHVGISYRRYNDWLRGELKRRKIKQSDVAQYLNLSRVSLVKRLSGEVEWSFREVLQVVELIEADLTEII